MRRRRSLPRLAVCLTAGVLAARSPAIAADAVRDAVPETIRRLDLQTAIPHAPEDEKLSSSWDLKMPRVLIWVLGALGVALVAYILRDMLPGWGRRTDEGWDMGAGVGPGVDGVAPGVGEADALATQGRFVEAMHVLLLVALAELRRRLKLDFADSLTSREIVRRARLSEEGTSALRAIVTRVELSYFGDYPASRADYETCRARYEALSGILARSAA